MPSGVRVVAGQKVERYAVELLVRAVHGREADEASLGRITLESCSLRGGGEDAPSVARSTRDGADRVVISRSGRISA